jgi:hypothetical protein
MVQPLRKAEEFPANFDEVPQLSQECRGSGPIETHAQGMDREPEEATLGEQVRARTDQPHKGDVGRPGTNEEIFQGSKMKELK